MIRLTCPDALEAVVGCWSRPGIRMAADGKRIRGPNRNGEGHHETAALARHDSGAPFALPDFDDDGGARSAGALRHRRTGNHRQQLHTTRRTAKLITGCGADRVLTAGDDAGGSLATLGSIDRERDATGQFVEDWGKAHGRLEQRSIHVMTPLDGAINTPSANRIARIIRYREELKTKAGDDRADHVTTSLDAGAASPEDLLRMNRRHRAVENPNHGVRDCIHGEDACLTRTGHGPARRAGLDNIALAPEGEPCPPQGEGCSSMEARPSPP